MNKYLEKIAKAASESEDSGTKKPGLAGRVAEGALGARLAMEAPQKLMGYHTVYHGTSKANADSIRKTGLDPKHGGGPTGAGAGINHSGFLETSKGKVHVTKGPITAAMFSGFSSAATKTRPSIVKARISDKMWDKFKLDPDAGAYKRQAATTTKKIGSNFISGGEGSKGRSMFLTKERLGDYYGSKAGKVRALKGVGLLAGGGALMAHSVLKGRGKKDE